MINKRKPITLAGERTCPSNQERVEPCRPAYGNYHRTVDSFRISFKNSFVVCCVLFNLQYPNQLDDVKQRGSIILDIVRIIISLVN